MYRAAVELKHLYSYTEGSLVLAIMWLNKQGKCVMLSLETPEVANIHDATSEV